MSRTVVITGSTQGTGYCVAETFAKDGWNVAITSRDLKKAQNAADELQKNVGDNVKIFGYQLEVLNEPQAVSMFADLKEKGCPVSSIVLVAANMGINMPSIFDVDYNDWIRVIDTNVGWNFMLVRNAAKYMVEAGGGSVVFVGSATAIRFSKNRTAYCTSKAGVHGLAKNLAVELGEYNIRVNTVVPGPIKTARWMANPEIRNSPQMKNPLGDIASFTDIANAALFLADSEKSRIITGAELNVDGGSLAQFCYEEEGIKLKSGNVISD